MYLIWFFILHRGSTPYMQVKRMSYSHSFFKLSLYVFSSLRNFFNCSLFFGKANWLSWRERLLAWSDLWSYIFGHSRFSLFPHKCHWFWKGFVMHLCVRCTILYLLPLLSIWLMSWALNYSPVSSDRCCYMERPAWENASQGSLSNWNS